LALSLVEEDFGPALALSVACRFAVRACLGGPTLCLVGEVVGLALARDPEFRFVSGIGL